jgi:protein-S-isoprenylcysteine O-methyltransferase Ste14
MQQVLIVAVPFCGALGGGWPGSVRTPFLIGGIIGAAAGAGMFFGSVLSLGSSFRPLPEPRGGGELKQSYLYGLVRHPLYGGLILLAFSWAALFSPLSLLPAVLLTAVLVGKSMLEEEWLAVSHPGYADYRRRVRHRFLPGII